MKIIALLRASTPCDNNYCKKIAIFGRIIIKHMLCFYTILVDSSSSDFYINNVTILL